jgi:hypothetical protein
MDYIKYDGSPDSIKRRRNKRKYKLQW